MEKENKKMKSHLLKEEKARILRLVERAKESDPRILHHENELRAERERRKEEMERKKKERRQQEEDAKRLAKEKKEREEQERIDKEKEKEAAIKKKRDDKRMKKELIIKLFEERVQDPRYNSIYLNIVLEKVHSADRDIIINTLQDESRSIEDLQKEFHAWLQELEERKKAASMVQKKPEKVVEEKQISKWTEEEITKLTKAFLKFPSGYPNRWEQIAFYLGSDNKTVDDIVKMAKELSISNIKRGGLIKEHLDKVIKGKQEKEKKTTVNLETAAEENVWSQDQQNALQKALKKHPSTIPKAERFKLIAEGVEGKSAKECFARVKEIKAKLAEKKK